MPNSNAVPKDDLMMQNQMPAQAEAQSSAVDSDRFSQLRRWRTSNTGYGIAHICMHAIVVECTIKCTLIMLRTALTMYVHK